MIYDLFILLILRTLFFFTLLCTVCSHVCLRLNHLRQQTSDLLCNARTLQRTRLPRINYPSWNPRSHYSKSSTVAARPRASRGHSSRHRGSPTTASLIVVRDPSVVSSQSFPRKHIITQQNTRLQHCSTTTHVQHGTRSPPQAAAGPARVHGHDADSHRRRQAAD